MTRPSYLTDGAIRAFIASALDEDIGEGDHSSLAAVPGHATNKANLLIKADGIIAGVELAEKIFKYYDPRIAIDFYKKDGDAIKKGEVAFVVEGPSRSLLSTERLVLNCMQRMSGIATYTHRLCQMIRGTTAQIMDTRKTTPNFRLPEKWAVLIGGGLNHRFALYDMIMLKDNHIDLAGGIGKAISNTKTYLASQDQKLKVEVEVRSLKEVGE
ncbi:MAG TPA: carboxylating nicotinate-nucleotide diphosphorylase, partial [Cyclobacteriaceae bacterium]|nr:carboxylating nicotinate-nucleotide diphosphorylase [Cyclobacteriaceae bacterium]